MEFFVPMILPTATAQQKGQNRKTGKYYKTPELKTAKDKYITAFAPHRPEKPFDGPLALTMAFIFHDDKHASGEYKITKPDNDNMVKLPKDCLTELGFWHDDAQVAADSLAKVWGTVPGVFVRITELEVLEK